MSSQDKNIFGFDGTTSENDIFKRTASFFNPAEDGIESSFSTQPTEDSKDVSLPATPEQNIKVRVAGKIYSIKNRMASAKQCDITNDFLDSTSSTSLGTSVRNCNKIHNSDDDGQWSRFKSLIPQQHLHLRSEGNSQILSSRERRTLFEEGNDGQPAIFGDAEVTPSTKKGTQNMFVIKTQAVQMKATKFNKIKAINPIPNIELLKESEKLPVSISQRKPSSALDLNALKPQASQASLHSTHSNDAFQNLEPKLNCSGSQTKLAPLKVPEIKHARISSAQGARKCNLPLPSPLYGHSEPAIQNQSMTSRKEIELNFTPVHGNSNMKKVPTTPTLCRLPKTPLSLQRVPSMAKIDEDLNIASSKGSNSCPKEEKHFNFEPILVNQVTREKTPLGIDMSKMKLDLRSLVSPQGGKTIEFNNTKNDFPDPGSKRSTGKFRNQELVLNKIFDPAKHIKNIELQ